MTWYCVDIWLDVLIEQEWYSKCASLLAGNAFTSDYWKSKTCNGIQFIYPVNLSFWCFWKQNYIFNRKLQILIIEIQFYIKCNRYISIFIYLHNMYNFIYWNVNWISFQRYVIQKVCFVAITNCFSWKYGRRCTIGSY